MSQKKDIEYRKAVTKYRASLMSNAKWCSLFRAIIDAEIVIERAEWRFIDSTHSIWMSFPAERDIHSTRFADGKFQPFEYRWLESVFVPRSFKPTKGVGYERLQDIDAILSALAKTGQYPIEESVDGIIIQAYLR